MKYKALILILIFGLAGSAYGYDKKQLNDTLTQIATNYATVGSVKVNQVKIHHGRIEVYTNSALSWLSLSQNSVDSLRGAAKAVIAPGSSESVRVYSEGHEIEDYITSINLSEAERRSKRHFTLPHTTALVKNESRAYSAPKGLDGKHIALYGSHGLYFHQAQERWIWQRARMFTTVEDLYTTSYTMPFLVPMLENAGAIVIQARERDRQTHEVIVDETAAQGSGWTKVNDGGWGPIPDNTLYEGENPFTMGGYTKHKAGTEEAALRYTPDMPVAGEYAVYISYKTLKNSTNAAIYTVKHAGIETQYSVNQQMGGSTWIYLGTFYFSGDRENNYVEVSAKGAVDKMVTSDAVRFGGGMGNVARYAQSNLIENVPSSKENGKSKAKKDEPRIFPTRDQVSDIAQTSGVPRWIEGSRYWLQYTGIPDSVYGYSGGKNDYTDDYASRGRWINYLIGGSAAFPDGPGLGIPVEMALAFHTDAGTTPMNDIIGTLLIYTDYDDDKDKTYKNGASRTLARDYADYMQTQLVNDVRALFAPEWSRRRLHNSSYAESRNPKIPVVLLEFLSHQNFADMKYGLDPSFRFVVSRAIYKSMLRFNHEQYGTPYVVQPLPVKDFAIRFGEGEMVELSWAERVDELEKTATPKCYVLYTRKEGEDWDNGVIVNGTTTSVKLEKDTVYDFKICAANDGGISFPSEVLSACKVSDEKGKALVINGFTRVSGPDHFESRDSMYGGFIPGHYGVPYMNEVNYIGEQYEFDRSQIWMSDDHCGFGSCYNNMRSESPIGNTFDYPAKHGRELKTIGISFVSTSVSAVDEIGDDYNVVDLILGKQKQTKIGTEKVIEKYPVYPDNLRAALRGYTGNILVSGAYIGTDMQSKEDQTFTKETLHYCFRADNACNNGRVNILKMLPRQSVEYQATLNSQIIPCENAGGIGPDGGSVVCARYDDSGVAAGVAYDQEYRQLIFGFPLESAKDFGQIYKAAIMWLTEK